MKQILLIEENKDNISLVKSLLDKIYEVTEVAKVEETVSLLSDKEINLILLGIKSNNTDYAVTVKELKDNPKTAGIPVIVLAHKKRRNMQEECYLAGADDFIPYPLNGVVLKEKICRVIELYELKYNMELSVAQESKRLSMMALSTVVTIANTLDARDRYAGGHSVRVATCARDIAENLGWTQSECDNIYSVALLHDIGMLAIPQRILNKPARLDDEEYRIVKEHPATGNEILRDINVLPHLREGALSHHERWDGRGYPEGKSGKDISIYARIIAVADAYDAMISDKIYRKHLSNEKIISEFERGKGAQFDPEITEVFIFMLKGGYRIDPGIAQSKESSDNATNDGGLNLLSHYRPGDNDEAADKDSLTGLFSRSYLNTRVGNKILSEHSGALMLLDLENTDKMNEIFGQDICDKVLRDFADLLNSIFREADVVCRTMSNQFAVYVSGDSGKGVIEKKAGMIIEAINKHDDFAKYTATLGISIGIALCPENGETFEELYGAADKALSTAKENGNNSYEIAK